MSRRDTIINVIIPEVVPSTYPDPRFKKLDAVWKPGAGYTTCGALPTYISKRLGMAAENAKDGMLDYGLVSMRNAAIRAGVWYHHDMNLRRFAAGTGMTDQMRLPQPGDMYMLCSGARHDEGCNCIGPTDPKEAYK